MVRKAPGTIVCLVCLALLALWPALGGCGGQAVTPQDSGTKQELRVYVAASLKKPMDAVIARFQEQKSVKVIPSYGPSGGLWTQIREGQPCDIYYSADWMYIETADREGRLTECRKFLKDNLVLVVSPLAGDKVKALEDLTKPGVTLVLCDPEAPAGVYADRALKNLGLWGKVQGNIKARPSTVNQAAIMVKEDQVDAGLVYASVAKGIGLDQVQVVGEEAAGEIVFGAGVIKGANETLAKEFLEFAVQNMDEFSKYGWQPYA